ncbi:unnamed protein product [Bemisia tabaci]|uniref:Uncharacterized protein n=1 Tax=Bemisia tabaci TaxID=7038 RepID=A0A9P0G4S6_BEMTA|nr:unnamed protein product [Bemisia tabaci]
MLFFGSTIGLLVSFTFTTCVSVQFPADEALESSNSSARSKQERQSKALHSYLVTSRPYQLINTSTPATEPKWRRELYITTTLGAGTNSYEPAAASFSDCSSNSQSCQNLKQEDSPTFRPYSQAELDKILREYREKNKTEHHSKLNSIEPLYGAASNIIASTSSSVDTILHDKSKSYHHSSNQHKNPYDDRQGWVTLEPVAWSSSQVQKWEPNPNRPTWPVPSEVAQWSGPPSTPQYGAPSPEHSPWTTDRPWKPPSYQYGSGGRPPVVQSHYTPISSGHLQFASSNNNYGPPHGGGGWGGGSSHPDIITDGRPDFPPDEPSSGHKPWGGSQSYGPPKPHTQVVYQGPIGAHEKPSYPSENGEGHWVLLSSTKGYSIPQRHRNMARSIRFDPSQEEEPKRERVASTRSVRLEVLPPLNGSETKITHGGILEVEKTHQTVDEAHREHVARSLRFAVPTGNGTVERVPRPGGRAAKATARADHGADAHRRDVRLAAVGGGVIPATMAMILPVILARKKRAPRRTNPDFTVLPAEYVFDGADLRPHNQRILHVYE